MGRSTALPLLAMAIRHMNKHIGCEVDFFFCGLNQRHVDVFEILGRRIVDDCCSVSKTYKAYREE